MKSPYTHTVQLNKLIIHDKVHGSPIQVIVYGSCYGNRIASNQMGPA